MHNFFFFEEGSACRFHYRVCRTTAGKALKVNILSSYWTKFNGIVIGRTSEELLAKCEIKHSSVNFIMDLVTTMHKVIIIGCVVNVSEASLS